MKNNNNHKSDQILLTKLLHSEWQFKRDIAGIMPTCCVIGCSNSTRKTKKKNDQSTPLGKTTSQLIFASDYNGLTVFVGFWFYQLLSQLISFATSFRIFDLNLAIMNSYWTTLFWWHSVHSKKSDKNNQIYDIYILHEFWTA